MSLRKRLRIKKVAPGLYTARPYWGHKAVITKIGETWVCVISDHVAPEHGTGIHEVDGGYTWVDVETRHCSTLTTAIEAINQYGYNEVETRNILNPDFGPIMISLHNKGGCCDPGTERYHSM